jgi:outer membrane biosynthesis protein TonB
MRRDARFWRNVGLIAVVHIAALIALLRWAGASKIESAQEITWLNTGSDAGTAVDNSAIEETPTPKPEQTPSPSPENQTTPAPSKSEIELPVDTPHPTPSPSPTPKPSPKVSPQSSPKKKASPKPSATPKKKRPPTEATPTKQKGTPAKKTAAKKSESKKSASKSGEKTAKAGNGVSGGQTNANASAANTGWYGNMLHDRFYREWAQPTTVVATGAKLSALARIRIERDGRISDFKIVRPSGNVVVDESVQAVGKKVTRVDALPGGIGNGGHYEVNINFALNSK